MWVVEPTDFVSPYAPLSDSIFDHEVRLRAAWQLAVASLERSARTSDTPEEAPAGGSEEAKFLSDKPDDSLPAIIQKLQKHIHDIQEEREKADDAAIEDDGPTPAVEAPAQSARRSVSGAFGRLTRRTPPNPA
ncbi:hypothetical protein [Actinoplanes sp. DH11]|uniref:hypothetical protein n=1 Tax=Actinoplanes sp. DH11 TaxID=2857011 RepID=UPI001E63BB9F|nr:hypothetical protein [Actinoplanes sp. DH11]